jgi:hypothetical protein
MQRKDKDATYVVHVQDNAAGAAHYLPAFAGAYAHYKADAQQYTKAGAYAVALGAHRQAGYSVAVLLYADAPAVAAQRTQTQQQQDKADLDAYAADAQVRHAKQQAISAAHANAAKHLQALDAAAQARKDALAYLRSLHADAHTAHLLDARTQQKVRAGYLADYSVQQLRTAVAHVQQHADAQYVVQVDTDATGTYYAGKAGTTPSLKDACRYAQANAQQLAAQVQADGTYAGCTVQALHYTQATDYRQD